MPVHALVIGCVKLPLLEPWRDPTIVFSSPQDCHGMRLFSLSMAILLLGLTIRLGPGTVPSGSNGAREPDIDERWYTPLPEDFRPHYDRDTTNRAKQTWEQYWRWVKVFYEGNLISAGWTQRSERLVTVIKSDPEQKKLRSIINAVGKEIGAEWAKDYAVRKINSADLLAWGKKLEEAKARDDGTGGELQRTIASIRDEHRKQRGSG
jgi:hypothetical protein